MPTGRSVMVKSQALEEKHLTTSTTTSTMGEPLFLPKPRGRGRPAKAKQVKNIRQKERTKQCVFINNEYVNKKTKMYQLADEGDATRNKIRAGCKTLSAGGAFSLFQVQILTNANMNKQTF